MVAPVYLTDQTAEAIKARLRAAVTEYDVSEGSPLGDVIGAVAADLVEVSVRARILLDQVFIATATGDRLDRHADMLGTARNAGAAATVVLSVLGDPGTVVPAGTRVASRATAERPAAVFATDAEATVPAGGTAEVAATAVAVGTAANVGAGALTVLLDYTPGVQAVTNTAAAAGGLDAESDALLRDRLLFIARKELTGGNADSYRVWAREVDGVGAADVVTNADVRGQVDVYLIDDQGLPAGQELVDQAQREIAPQVVAVVEAEDLDVANAAGVSEIDRADDNGLSVQMAAADGELTSAAIGPTTLADEDGIWELRVRALVENAVGDLACFRFGVWNDTTGAWCSRTTLPGTEAYRDLTPADMQTAFGTYVVDFYWNGTDAVRPRLIRLADDATAVVVVDRLVYRSTFSTLEGGGKAPVGARVTVLPAEAVEVEVSANVFVFAGYDKGDVADRARAALAAYFRDAAFAEDRTINYARVGHMLLNLPGLRDYGTLRLNGGVENIPVGPTQVAVLTVTAFQTWDEFDRVGRTWDRFDALEETWNEYFNREAE